MTMTPLKLSDVNLADADRFARATPHDVWRLLRAEAPVHWNEGTEWFPGFWSITKYDDLIAVSRDPATFISGRGITMGSDPNADDPSTGYGKMMIVTDPPRHVRMRRLVNKGFTPRMVAQLEPHIREVVTHIIDDVAPKGQCDFVTDVAARLPLAVICDMMGVPREDAGYMFELTNRTLGADDPEYQTAGGDVRATIQQAQMEMFGYFMKLLGGRKLNRRDDLVSVLVDAEIDGEKLTDEDILFFCYLLILAGNETTRNATSGGMLALIEHPDEYARLRAKPEMLPTAVEEILRWTSPVMHMARLASRDTELHGVAIRQGERLVLWYPSANRDEDVFENPDVFDIGREPNDHVAFGIGEHFCLGAGLARLELRVMFEELLRRLPDIAPDGEVERLRSTFIGGIKHMPVKYTPVG
jgi:cholest-4-en-3-one 26-monooxygenase